MTNSKQEIGRGSFRLVALSGIVALVFIGIAISDLGLERIRVPAAIIGSAALLAWFLLTFDRSKNR
ncbi:hypothetical protein [Rhodoluna sp.]|jgi:putative effector of murein hydrolase LrgA (UPF0299 family)|uniref:hypothetical protein n=1 Tax=Rhodoluna sp. TaxID=1969481 RepID=UPI0025E14165|nr:hypothetical protein [Rhodoluna sp.]